MANILQYSARRYLSSTARVFQSSKGLQGPSAVSGGHEGGFKIWRNMSFFVAFPCIGLCMLNCVLKHKEEAHHERPEFVPYEHMRIRNKRFPWGQGQKSLFHNPHTNALPDGYEASH